MGQYPILTVIIITIFTGLFKGSGAETRNENMNKVNRLLILTATKNPLANIPNTTTVSGGIVEEILLDILSEKLNFTYIIKPPSDIMSSGILLPNQSWTGSTGQLQRKEVDMYVTATAPTPARLLVTDVSYPVYFVDVGILIPFPRETDKSEVIYLALQFSTRIGLPIAFVFIIFFTWLIHRISNPNTTDHSQDSLSYWTLILISAFTSQGVNLRNKAVSFRLACASIFLGLFIICNYYTGAYTSMLSTPSFKPLVNSIEELANSQTVKTLLIKGSSTDEYFMLTNDPTFKKIGDQMRLHPERRILNAFTVDDISTIVKDDVALIVTAQSLIQKSYEINRDCRVTMVEKTFYSRGQSYTYPKNSPLTPIVNKQILLMQQFGLTNYADRRAASISRNRCSIADVQTTQSKTVVRMGLKDLVGAFIILGAGIGLATLVFVIELLIKLFKKRRGEYSHPPPLRTV